MEAACEHGIGHDLDIHGCDGCCMTDDFPLRQLYLTWYSRIVVRIAIEEARLPLKLDVPDADEQPSTWAEAWKDWKAESQLDSGPRWGMRKPFHIRARYDAIPTPLHMERLVDALLSLNPNDVRDGVRESELRTFRACAYRATIHAVRDIRASPLMQARQGIWPESRQGG